MPENASMRDQNPLLVREGLPPFDRIDPGHVVPAVRQFLAEAEDVVAGLEKSLVPTWDGLMVPLQKLDILFEYGWGPVSHLINVRNSPELREAHKTVLKDIVTFGLRVGQSEPLYKGYQAMRNGPEWESLDEVQRRILEKKILDAQLAGVGLAGDDRKRFNEIESELSQLATEFNNNVLDSVKAYSLVVTDKADTEGMPPSLLRLAAQSYNQARSEGEPEATPEGGPWRFTLDIPIFMPFMQHCRNRTLREEITRAAVTKASSGQFDNTQNVVRILRLRCEKARLLGYSSFAEVSLAKKMAPSVDAVLEMLEKLRTASWDSAVGDLDEIRGLAAESGQKEPVEQWDVMFWSERLRERKFDFTDEQLRPYFPLPGVLDGLFGLVNRIFGIEVRPADGEAPVWHGDVRFFKVFDEKGAQIAAFYLDPYSRPENKRGGAWMDTCINRAWVDGGLRLPVAYMVCNGTPPVGGTPSLMAFNEVRTLFHEFGHGLQHMLTKVDHSDAAGIHGVEWDAVEFPSHFMENWCYHKPTLLGMTSHVETGERLPEELFQKLVAAKNFRAGSMMLRQLTFGMTDMELHHSFDPDGDRSVLDVQRDVAEKTMPLPAMPEDRFLCSFAHIFAGGYAAGYYSYKWAEVLSADAFAAFEEAGLDNEEEVARIGRRFRDTILASGGGRHPMDLFRDFRGREPSPEPLLRHSGLA